MKRSMFSKEQIVRAISQAEAGILVDNFCRRSEVSGGTI